jgi:hypothetical protein
MNTHGWIHRLWARLSVHGAAACLVGAFAAMGAAAQGARSPERAPAAVQPSEAELKSIVLECDRVSRQQVLGFSDAAACSTAWEALKVRAFAGESEALLAWWREHRSPVDAPESPVASSRP